MSQAARLGELLAGGGIWRMGDLVRHGVAAATVRRALAAGDIEQLSRGLYRRVGAAHVPNVHLAEALARLPGGIVCLHSAAHAQGLGDEAPACVWVAIPNSQHPARIDWPPIRYVRWRSEAAFVSGVVERVISDVRVRMTDPARTVVDMLRMPTLVAEAQALACLRDYLQAGHAAGDLQVAARALGVDRRLSPLLRAATILAGLA